MEKFYQIQYRDLSESDVWENRKGAKFPFDPENYHHAAEELGYLQRFYSETTKEFRLIVVTLEEVKVDV